MSDKDYSDMIKILEGAGFEVMPPEPSLSDPPQRRKTRYLLSEWEARRLEATPQITDKVIIRLGTRLGLRVSEMHVARIGQIERRMVVDHDNDEEVEVRFLHVWGKKTRQKKGSGEKKHRMVYMDLETFEFIEEMKDDFDLDEVGYLALKPDGTCFSMSGLRSRIYKLARDGGIGLKEDGMKTFVSGHDLRRFWATNGLQVQRIDTQVMLDQGGWASPQAMQPYQSQPTPDIIYKNLKRGGAL